MYLGHLLLLPDLVIGGSSLPLDDAGSTPLLYQPHSITLWRPGGGGGEGERGGVIYTNFSHCEVYICMYMYAWEPTVSCTL